MPRGLKMPDADVQEAVRRLQLWRENTPKRIAADLGVGYETLLRRVHQVNGRLDVRMRRR